MDRIDDKVLERYNEGIEKSRLRTGLGNIEFERSKELMLARLPGPPARIYDIGGAYGEYAWWLSSLGYEVDLFDLSETNIAMSSDLAMEYPGVQLHSAEVADARQISRPDAVADAVLLMGPLYHITAQEERAKALNEAKRLLKPCGLLFAAAITRFSTLLWATSVYGTANRLLEEDSFMEMAAHEIEYGGHIPPESTAYNGLGTSHFHSPSELEREIEAIGFSETKVHGVVGGGWLVPNLDEMWKNEVARKAIMRSVRLIDGERDIIGLSTHLLAVARKP